MASDEGFSVKEDSLGGEERGELDFFFFFPALVWDAFPFFGCFFPLLFGDFFPFFGCFFPLLFEDFVVI